MRIKKEMIYVPKYEDLLDPADTQKILKKKIEERLKTELLDELLKQGLVSITYASVHDIDCMRDVMKVTAEFQAFRADE